MRLADESQHYWVQTRCWNGSRRVLEISVKHQSCRHRMLTETCHVLRISTRNPSIQCTRSQSLPRSWLAHVLYCRNDKSALIQWSVEINNAGEDWEGVAYAVSREFACTSVIFGQKKWDTSSVYIRSSGSVICAGPWPEDLSLSHAM